MSPLDQQGFGPWFGFGGRDFPDLLAGVGVFLVGYDINVGAYATAGREGCACGFGCQGITRLTM